MAVDEDVALGTGSGHHRQEQRAAGVCVYKCVCLRACVAAHLNTASRIRGGAVCSFFIWQKTKNKKKNVAACKH